MENSILTFLAALHGSLAESETYRLDITKNGNSLDMIVIPLLNDGNSTIPDEAQATRAALSLPLAMTGMDMTELATEFGNRLQGYGDARQSTSESYQELLATLKDATASTKNATATNKDKTATKEKIVKPTTKTVVKNEKTATETKDKSKTVITVKPEEAVETRPTTESVTNNTSQAESAQLVSAGLFSF